MGSRGRRASLRVGSGGCAGGTCSGEWLRYGHDGHPRQSDGVSSDKRKAATVHFFEIAGGVARLTLQGVWERRRGWACWEIGRWKELEVS